jgi:hypothetical protein
MVDYAKAERDAHSAHKGSFDNTGYGFSEQSGTARGIKAALDDNDADIRYRAPIFGTTEDKAREAYGDKIRAGYARDPTTGGRVHRGGGGGGIGIGGACGIGGGASGGSAGSDIAGYVGAGFLILAVLTSPYWGMAWFTQVSYGRYGGLCLAVPLAVVILVGGLALLILGKRKRTAPSILIAVITIVVAAMMSIGFKVGIDEYRTDRAQYAASEQGSVLGTPGPSASPSEARYDFDGANSTHSCQTLMGLGWGYDKVFAYWGSLGRPGDMDDDHDDWPCETVYGQQGGSASPGASASPSEARYDFDGANSTHSCQTLMGLGWGYDKVLAYWGSLGRPGDMDDDHDDWPCETVYGQQDGIAPSE